jgi:hypothetical protein
VLLKVWLCQRFGGQAASPTGFQLCLVLVHLVAVRKLSLQMSSYHMVRVVLSYLKNTDLRIMPIVLPHHGEEEVDEEEEEEADEGEEAEEGDEGEEDEEEGGRVGARGGGAAAARKAARKAAAAEGVATLGSYFPWVLVDASGSVNYGAGVSAGALVELSKHAAASLDALDARTLGDAQSFEMLLTERRALSTRYDALLHVQLPTADAPPPPAAGVLPLPPTTPDDPSDGADAAALSGGTVSAAPSGGGAPSVAASVSGLEALLRRGLAERVLHVRVWRAPLAAWNPLAHAAHGVGGGSVFVGLWLDAAKALAVVDRGPSPNTPSAAAWTSLWGGRSETRRFKVRRPNRPASPPVHGMSAAQLRRLCTASVHECTCRALSRVGRTALLCTPWCGMCPPLFVIRRACMRRVRCSHATRGSRRETCVARWAAAMRLSTDPKVRCPTFPRSSGKGGVGGEGWEGVGWGGRGGAGRGGKGWGKWGKCAGWKAVGRRASASLGTSVRVLSARERARTPPRRQACRVPRCRRVPSQGWASHTRQLRQSRAPSRSSRRRYATWCVPRSRDDAYMHTATRNTWAHIHPRALLPTLIPHGPMGPHPNPTRPSFPIHRPGHGRRRASRGRAAPSSRCQYRRPEHTPGA